jgi:hypothetical protein
VRHEQAASFMAEVYGAVERPVHRDDVSTGLGLAPTLSAASLASTIALPCVNVFRFAGERISDYRVYMDIAPVWALRAQVAPGPGRGDAEVRCMWPKRRRLILRGAGRR